MLKIPIARPGLASAVVALLAASAWCVLLALGRAAISGQGAHVWLSGNLFLAWLPLLFALLICDRLRVEKRATLRRVGWLVLLTAGWFFFFPNAPYLVTDFVHLRPRPPVPLWFDILLIAGFAGTGLLLGYLSLFLLQEIVRARLGRRAGRVFALGVLALASFGVFLGRFGRWNSWDVLWRPRALLRGSWDAAAHPFSQPLTGVFCCVLFFSLVAGYAAVCAFAALGRDWRELNSETPQRGIPT